MKKGTGNLGFREKKKKGAQGIKSTRSPYAPTPAPIPHKRKLPAIQTRRKIQVQSARPRPKPSKTGGEEKENHKRDVYPVADIKRCGGPNVGHKTMT
ncbi:hypothetical protein BU23DRAFT_38863 [Bimuria novae-zelandiae CBS 107.79]|uniref:Uncharacterized protein n=1 Tax=Bimuria novae-zelandiae CBS 107.79 TaxID=1447943 RepID=A0A6A5UQ38_9PLEO|nr:hypothetical protein BU23DRAFT_38863 [Bimuria novae-zelandiae CBS 107.79]